MTRRATRLLRPDACFSSALAIRPGWLLDQGIGGLLLDLDNTIVPRGQGDPAPGIGDWVEGLERAGIGSCIVSNTGRPRLAETGRLLGLPVVGDAMKPLARGYERACGLLGIGPEECAMVGDQSYTDVLGAHLFGMRAFMVMPLARKDPLHTRLLRGIDRLAVRGMEVLT